MAYVSIVEKLNVEIYHLARDIAENVDRYNVNAGEYPTCEMITYELLKQKREKILNKLEIKVQEHAILDEGGSIVCFDYTVMINGKHRKLSDLNKGNYWVSDSVLPNGKKVKDVAVVAQHYYV